MPGCDLSVPDTLTHLLLWRPWGRGGGWGTEKVSDLPKVMRRAAGRTGIRTRADGLHAPAVNVGLVQASPATIPEPAVGLDLLARLGRPRARLHQPRRALRHAAAALGRAGLVGTRGVRFMPPCSQPGVPTASWGRVGRYISANVTPGPCLVGSRGLRGDGLTVE